MSETPTGTDRVELTLLAHQLFYDESDDANVCGCGERAPQEFIENYPDDWEAPNTPDAAWWASHVSDLLDTAALAERDNAMDQLGTSGHALVAARRRLATFEDEFPAVVRQRDAARAELAAANAKISKWAEDYKKLAHDCGGTEMDRQALAARCAELEKQREALSFELQALRATPWHQRMEKAEATLDRVTALADEWEADDLQGLNPQMEVTWPHDDLRAALTPEGKPDLVPPNTWAGVLGEIRGTKDGDDDE